MINRRLEYTSEYSLLQKPASVTPNKSFNDGLGIPIENLTHITSYLDPPALMALSRVNSTFYRHAQDDHTWHMAFVRNFLGLDPHSDLTDTNAGNIMFQRSESSWKREYIVRFNLIK